MPAKVENEVEESLSEGPSVDQPQRAGKTKSKWRSVLYTHTNSNQKFRAREMWEVPLMFDGAGEFGSQELRSSEAPEPA